MPSFRLPGPNAERTQQKGQNISQKRLNTRDAEWPGGTRRKIDLKLVQSERVPKVFKAG